MSKLTIVRGLPGSSKSTYAKSLNVYHVEADFYFMVDSKYQWDPNKVGAAHGWCRSMVDQAMKSKMDVVVSNTFTRVKEFSDYIDMAREYGYTVEVISCIADYGNVHNVPTESIDKMRKRWEEFDGEIIYNSQN